MSLNIHILKFTQKEKNKHYILMNLENELYIDETRKMLQMNLFAEQE